MYGVGQEYIKENNEVKIYGRNRKNENNEKKNE